jgi:hypothetical protein
MALFLLKTNVQPKSTFGKCFALNANIKQALVFSFVNLKKQLKIKISGCRKALKE